MATATMTMPENDHNTGKDTDKYARIVKFLFQGNMAEWKRIEDSKVIVPVRTISNPSPLKKTAANRLPGQTHTRSEIDGALNHELATARFLMHDLGDHGFGHIVSTRLAKDILQKFVEDKVVQVCKGPALSRNHSNLLAAGSDHAQRAIQQAFENADYYDCIRIDTDSNGGPPGRPQDLSTNMKSKGKGKQKAKTYSFRWPGFPEEPLCEDEVVRFLNDITDRAFAIAKPELAVANPKLRHRFAAPRDKYHAVPLSYEPDGEDMRPDFLLLPIEAFSEDLKTVNPKYVNFTASCLVGESKNRDLAAGVEQLQRYARGLKRAQPWVYYVLGLTITKDKAVLLRGEGSGTECLELMLTDGRGCIEFIRILLGLALADKVDLGHNPDVVLEGKEQACKIRNVTRRPKPTIPKRPHRKEIFSVPDALPQPKTKAKRTALPYSDSVSSRRRVIPSSSSKRAHSEIGDDDEGTQSKKCRTDECVEDDVDRFVFYPVAVYDHRCLGVLFTASSVRGRGTTVFCVLDLEDDNKLLALRMAWQDVARVEEQDAVMKHLKDQESHANMIVPLKIYKVERRGEVCTTLGEIRGFLDDQIEQLGVENRVLTVSVSELKRPVRYFWGVHDFVRGLRGALLGHEYLTKIGILHRDISENNIVLGLRPEDERGYLIDLDMAILQKAEQHTPPEPDELLALASIPYAEESPTLLEHDRKKPMKALRTGTFPYISYNVLSGGRHTQFDDVESFLYVLLLFFFSYAGPLSASELRKADEEGFVQPIGSGRPFHMRNWPKKYASWADGDATEIAAQKHYAIFGGWKIIQSDEFKQCLENYWPQQLHAPIRALIVMSFNLFFRSALRTAATVSRTEVSHAEFVGTLDKWLDLYAGLEDQFSNSPFK